jgi:hypothetical protein
MKKRVFVEFVGRYKVTLDAFQIQLILHYTVRFNPNNTIYSADISSKRHTAFDVNMASNFSPSLEALVQIR